MLEDAWSVSVSCVSQFMCEGCKLQNCVFGVHLSGSQKESWVVLNWDCRENKWKVHRILYIE